MTSETSATWDPRLQGDRRQRPTPMLSRYSLFGGRRASSREETYTDRYGLGIYAVLLAITTLNVLDSFFTLAYLQRGGSEANPIAAWLIGLGPGSFVFWKTFVLGAALGVLCLHKNFKRARVGIWFGVALYVLLMLYHLYLFFRNDIGHEL